MDAEFEKWLEQNGYGNHFDTLHMVNKDNLYKLWQAGRQAGQAAEREACAGVAERATGDETDIEHNMACSEIASRIRARGGTQGGRGDEQTY